MHGYKPSTLETEEELLEIKSSRLAKQDRITWFQNKYIFRKI